MNDEFVNVELARLRGVVEALRGGAVGAHRPFGEAAGRLLGIVRERLEALRATVVFAEGAGEGRVAAAVDAEGRVVPVQELDRRPVAMEPTRRARAGDITFRGRSIRVDFDTGAGGASGWLELTFREVRSGLSHHEHQLVLGHGAVDLARSCNAARRNACGSTGCSTRRSDTARCASRRRPVASAGRAGPRLW